MRCFFDRESVSAEILLPGNSGYQAKTMTSFTLFTGHYPTVCVRVCVCACRSCDGEGRKDKGGGEKVRDVKTVVWIKLSIRMYVCRYLCISRMHVFPQNMMFRNGSICAMKSVPGREQHKTTACHCC